MLYNRERKHSQALSMFSWEHCLSTQCRHKSLSQRRRNQCVLNFLVPLVKTGRGSQGSRVLLPKNWRWQYVSPREFVLVCSWECSPRPRPRPGCPTASKHNTMPFRPACHRLYSISNWERCSMHAPLIQADSYTFKPLTKHKIKCICNLKM